MVISSFNSFLGFFAGINLGFAAIDFFKNKLSKNIFKINITTLTDFHKLKEEITHETEVLENTIKDLEAKNNTTDNSETQGKHIKIMKSYYENLKDLSLKMSVEKENLQIKEEKEQEFINVLESIARITGLYCVFMLVLGGIQNQLGISADELEGIIMVFGSLIAIFCYCIFCGAYSERIVINDITFGFKMTCIIFAGFLATSIWAKQNIFGWLRLFFIFFFPIFIYLSIITFKLLNCENYQERKLNENIKNVWIVLKQNKCVISKFALILFLFFIPVMYYFLEDSSNQTTIIKNVLLHIIVLTIPINTYVYIDMRTNKHKDKFKKLLNRYYKDNSKKFATLINVFRLKSE